MYLTSIKKRSFVGSTSTILEMLLFIHEFFADEQRKVWVSLEKQQPHYRSLIHGTVSKEEM